MEKIRGIVEVERTIGEIMKQKNVELKGCIHKIREMTDFKFIILRTKDNLIQCIANSELTVTEGCWVKVKGEVLLEERSTLGFEIKIDKLEILAKPLAELPVVINKKELNLNLDTKLDNRILALRHPKERAIFKIQEGIIRAFREFFYNNNFTEIKSPKMVFDSAEGGADAFRLDYFGKEVVLAQSPQFYKEIMVGVYERVFEIGPVFRAEKHNTSRHINEYISLDAEIGFIESFHDIMNMEVALLKYIFEYLKSKCEDEISLLEVKLPDITEIPAIKFVDIKNKVAEKYNRPITDYNDLDPEEEKLISQYVLSEYGSEFVFVTHYPTKKRPFYAMDSIENKEETESFDLLFRGIEITTGGQRIHDYEMLISKMKSRGMRIENFESFLYLHKVGVPPHGGLGMGLERLTSKIIGASNVREACLFPRDVTRVTP